MIDYIALQGAFTLLSTDGAVWLVMIPGLIIGLIGGAIPGISVSIAMAIFLPMTVYMDFLPAILFLSAIFTGASFSSAIPSVLMGLPGAPSAVATTFDGYPMARAGRHNEALGIALFASCFGALFGYVLLFVLIEPLSWMVLKLGPFEMLLIGLWGLALISSFNNGYIVRGMMAGVLGVLLGTIGMNDAGYIRGTMGISILLDGVPVIPAMMGLFIASQLFTLGRQDYLVTDEASRRMNVRRVLQGLVTVCQYPRVLFRGGCIGAGIGIVPGVGASVSNLVSYARARAASTDPDHFGKGAPEGVIAAESANSSSEGGSMATLLALGIPGGGGTAILLAAFSMHNINGGPKFLSDNKDVVYAIIFGSFAQVAMLLFIGLGFIIVASSIVRIPLRLLIPSVLSLALFGTYAITGNLSGPVTFFVFSVFGWLLGKFNYSIPAVVVGLLLGNMVESELLRSYQLSGGHYWSFILQRPIALILLALLVTSLTVPAALKWRRNARAGRFAKT